MFIVNYDMKNNTMVWHKNNDTKDNYYKHLFPVTDKQYNEILRVHEQDGAITDKQIMEIVNAVEFKPDDWKLGIIKELMKVSAMSVLILQILIMNHTHLSSGRI